MCMHVMIKKLRNYISYFPHIRYKLSNPHKRVNGIFRVRYLRILNLDLAGFSKSMALWYNCVLITVGTKTSLLWFPSFSFNKGGVHIHLVFLALA